MGEVIYLCEPDMTVEAMLEKTLKDRREGRAVGRKAVLIVLNDEGERYDLAIRPAGMRLSEGVALLDIAKTEIKREMGY